MTKTKKVFIISLAVFFSSHLLFAEELDRANYEVSVGQFNADGLVDILLRPKGQFVLINLDDLAIPLFSKSAFDAVVIASFSNGQYQIDASVQDDVIDQTQWNAGDYDVISADFNGDGSQELFLKPRVTGYSSFILSSATGQGKPTLLQQLSPVDFGVDFGEVDVSINPVDSNNDGRTDLMVNRGGRVLAVLLANSNGTFNALAAEEGNEDDLNATISAVWKGFCDQLGDGDISSAVEYFSVETKEVYEAILTELGSDIKSIPSHWSDAIPIILEKNYAEYAIEQTAGEQVELHLIGFSRDSNGQWLIQQL